MRIIKWEKTVIGLVLALAIAAPAEIAGRNPFAYVMKMTPEEGLVDPSVERRFTRQWKGCQGQASTTAANAGCYQPEFARQDAALNDAWKPALARTTPPLRPALVAAQRRWIAARDPFCRSFVDGLGTVAPVAYLDCRVELTIRRTIWLEALG